MGYSFDLVSCLCNISGRAICKTYCNGGIAPYRKLYPTGAHVAMRRLRLLLIGANQVVYLWNTEGLAYIAPRRKDKESKDKALF